MDALCHQPEPQPRVYRISSKSPNAITKRASGHGMRERHLRLVAVGVGEEEVALLASNVPQQGLIAHVTKRLDILL